MERTATCLTMKYSKAVSSEKYLFVPILMSPIGLSS